MLLLEKAFAKIFGSYNSLERGSSRCALIDLTKCPVFTFDFQSKETLELVYGSDYEKQLELFSKEELRSSDSANRNSRNAANEDSNGIKNSFGDMYLDPKNSNLISPVRSLRFSLIKTSKPAKDFWNKLKSSVNSNYVVMAVARDEKDPSKEGFGYCLIRVEEVENTRLIGKHINQRVEKPMESAGSESGLGARIPFMDGEPEGADQTQFGIR